MCRLYIKQYIWEAPTLRIVANVVCASMSQNYVGMSHSCFPSDRRNSPFERKFSVAPCRTCFVHMGAQQLLDKSLHSGWALRANQTLFSVRRRQVMTFTLEFSQAQRGFAIHLFSRALNLAKICVSRQFDKTFYALYFGFRRLVFRPVYRSRTCFHFSWSLRSSHL